MKRKDISKMIIIGDSKSEIVSAIKDKIEWDSENIGFNIVENGDLEPTYLDYKPLYTHAEYKPFEKPRSKYHK